MIKSAIICVDDELNVLESIKKELLEAFGDEHLIEATDNPFTALEAFDELSNDDYRIPVVIADYIMPGMKGDELLQRVHERNTRTYKIMLTGQAEAQGIANAVNNANLYRIITKPWNYDNFIFTINEAIKNYVKNEYIEKQYLELKRNKELSETLKKYNFKYNKLIEEKKKVFYQVIPSLIELSTVFERGYFLNHTKFIIALSLKIAEELQLEIDDKISIVICGILHHKIMQEMPAELVGIDPITLDGSGRKEYFSKFNELIDNLSKNEYLNKYILILSQLWEHYDGTGLPHGLTLNSLTKISQILNLCINYHNGVYAFDDEAKKTLEEKSEVYQTPEVTSQRHAHTMQYLFKNSSWYDMDIIDIFQRLVKSKTLKEIFLEKSLIKVYAHGDDIRVVKYEQKDYHADSEQKIVIPIEKLMKDMKSKTQEDIAKSKRALETTIPLSELKAGMVLDTDIITKFGRLILGKNSTLTADDLDEINKIKRHGLIKDDSDIKVLIPREV